MAIEGFDEGMKKQPGRGKCAAVEPEMYKGFVKLCHACGSSNCKFKYLNNQKLDQPRYLCQDCEAWVSLVPHGRFKGKQYEKQRNKDPDELQGLHRKCSKCGSVNNALFKYYNNKPKCGRTQPRFQCLSCNFQFQMHFDLEQKQLFTVEKRKRGHQAPPSRFSSPKVLEQALQEMAAVAGPEHTDVQYKSYVQEPGVISVPNSADQGPQQTGVQYEPSAQKMAGVGPEQTDDQYSYFQEPELIYVPLSDVHEPELIDMQNSHVQEPLQTDVPFSDVQEMPGAGPEQTNWPMPCFDEPELIDMQYSHFQEPLQTGVQYSDAVQEPLQTGVQHSYLEEMAVAASIPNEAFGIRNDASFPLDVEDFMMNDSDLPLTDEVENVANLWD